MEHRILFQIVIKVIKEKHRGFFCHHMAQDDFAGTKVSQNILIPGRGDKVPDHLEKGLGCCRFGRGGHTIRGLKL